GQLVGHLVLAVVDAAGDDRAVGITLEELHDHFVADPRNVDVPPILPGPRVGDTHPARAGFVVPGVTVPVELDFHPAVDVGPDLLAGLADHGRSLRAGDAGLGREAPGPERRLARNRDESALVNRFRRAAVDTLVTFHDDLVLGGNDEVLAVLILT